MERGKVKCHKYWPKKAGEVQVWGNFQVKNAGEPVTEEHFIRQKLELSYESQTRTVYHYKFTQVNTFILFKNWLETYLRYLLDTSRSYLP